MGRLRSVAGAMAGLAAGSPGWESLRRRLGGLPPRVLAAIFLAALVTSFAVAFASTRSMGDLVRDELERRFPARLHVAGERLDVWFIQRRLDLVALADGEAADAAEGTASAEAFARIRARASLATRIEAARRRLPVFESIRVLDARGVETLGVGADSHLPVAVRRELAAALRSVPSRSVWLDDLDTLVFSTAMPGDATSHSLHALVSPRALAGVLEVADLGGGALYVVDDAGRVLVAAGAHDGRSLHPHASAAALEPVAVDEYTTAEGLRVVASAMVHPRFGWTLVFEEPEATAFAPVTAMVRRILAGHLAVVAALSGLAAFLAHRFMPRWRPERADEGDEQTPRLPERDESMLIRALHEMQRRAHRYRVELLEKRREVEDANDRLRCQNERLVNANEVLERLSITDELTGLHNRRYFREHLPREMKRALRTRETLSLILFDIDDFKQLNDRFGHSVGDAVLRRVATVMSRETREMDLLSRYGGEEFALLASHTVVAGAVALAEKIRLAVSRTKFGIVDLDGRFEVKVTISAGVAAFRGDEKALFNDADSALYRAKASGKDCVIAADDIDDGSEVLADSEER